MTDKLPLTEMADKITELARRTLATLDERRNVTPEERALYESFVEAIGKVAVIARKIDHFEKRRMQ